jgi:hypothetical protein
MPNSHPPLQQYVARLQKSTVVVYRQIYILEDRLLKTEDGESKYIAPLSVTSANEKGTP